MDLYRALGGVVVAVVMMVAPQLGAPFMQALPLPPELGLGDSGSADGKTTLAQIGIEVGERVRFQTLDAHGNRSHLRVLWVELEGQKLDRSGQGQGKVARAKLALAAPGGLLVGDDVLPVRPGDEVTVEGFEGKWAYATEGMVGIVRMEGTVLAARLGERGLRPMGTEEASVAPGWALRGEAPGVANVTVRAGRAAFVTFESDADGETLQHVKARDVRVNGAPVAGTRWGEGALDAVSFTVAGPGVLRGDGANRTLAEGERVEVTDFIGAYLIFFTKGDEGRVALQGYAARVAVNAGSGAPAAGLNKAPVAAFDHAPREPAADQPVKFWDRSADLDGLVVKRVWSFGDGQGSEEANPSHAYAAPGVYTVTLTVFDNKLVSSVVKREIRVLNNAPTAAWDASPRSPSVLDAVQFLDSSSDPDGGIVAWQWSFGDGATSDQQHPRHQYAANGVYNVSLTVWDDRGERATSARPLEVRNLAPVTRFAWEPDAPTSGERITFRDQSGDPDGAIVAWQWDFGDGARSTEQHPSHAFLSKGPHRVTLTVKDDDGATHTLQSTVSVANAPPVADFRLAPEPPAEGQPTRFLDLSRDPDGRIIEWLWNFGDGALSRSPAPNHTYLAGGTVTVTLTVKDDDGARTTAMQTFTINRRPVAAWAVTPSVPTTQGPARFTDGSVDPDGTLAAWAWSFGDGNTSAARNPEHTYARPGAYRVALTVTDHQGATGTLERMLNVSGTGPLADFAWEPAVPATNQDATFIDRSTDPDGGIASRAWSFPDGTTLHGALVTKRFPQAGSHLVTLTVVDTDGNQATSAQLVRVNAAPLPAFTFDPANPSTVATVQFTDASTDADGTVAAWRWDFGNGLTSTERHPAVRFDRPDRYAVRLTITDNEGATASLVRNLTVGSLAPTAAFEVLTQRPVAGVPVELRDDSRDLDGHLTAWEWKVNGEVVSREPQPAIAFPAPGGYAVRLKVTDNDGRIGEASRNVRVFAAEPVGVALRVVYPDNQPVDLTRAGVGVELREASSGVLLAKDGFRPLEVGADGVARGTFGAGEWAPGDQVVATVRMPAAFVDQSRSLTLPEGGDLGTFTVRMPMTGRLALATPTPTQGTYTDPTERVEGVLRMSWRDGTPVRGAVVTLAFAWEHLGTPGVGVENPLLRAMGATQPDGSFPFAVPFNAGLPQGPGSYLPGRHAVLATVDHGGASPPRWVSSLAFEVDPGGVRTALRGG